MDTSSPRREPIPGWLPLVILAATIAITFYRLIAGEVLFWGLPALQFQPWRMFAITELGAGRLPLWNPFNGAGEPLIANYQLGLFYPPTLLSLLIAPGANGLGWLGMLHLFWAGLGVCLYTRRLGLSPFGRGVGALAYALNGAVVARFGTLPMVEAAAWLPWLLVTAERLITGEGLRQQIRRMVGFTAVVTLLLMVGHAQWAFYSLLLTGMYTLYRLWIAPIGVKRDQRLRLMIILVIGVLIAVGVAAIQLVPTAELQAQSQRAGGTDESFALNFSDQPTVWLTQFDPFLFGNPGDGTYTLQGEYFEFAQYIGFLPAILAVIAIGYCTLGWRRLRPLKTGQLSIALVPCFGLSVAIGFLFSLGKNSSIFVFLYRHIPTFNQFQAPSRWLLWAVFGLSLLAAIGASRWQPTRIGQQRARVGLIGAIALAFIGILLLGGGIDSPPTVTRGLITIGLLGALTALAFVTQPSLSNAAATRRWQIAVLIAMAVELIWATVLLNPTTPPDFYTAQPKGSSSAGRTFQTDAALNHIEFDRFLLVNDYRAAGQNRAAYRSADLPEMNLLDQVQSFNLFEPLRIAAIDRYTTLLNTTPTAGLYRAAAIATLDDPAPTRVWLVGTLIPAADPFTAIADPGWNPLTSAFVPDNAAALDSFIEPTDSATFMTDTPQQIVIATHAAHQAALIVADTWYPGWVATIDGQPAPILQANGAFRAVIVPAGDHQIEMRYQPESLRIGGIVSAASLIVLIGLWIGTALIRPVGNRTPSDI